MGSEEKQVGFYVLLLNDHFCNYDAPAHVWVI